ncbi:transcriptional regulator [Sphaerisporangium siamense]|uniref:PucR C-terminal helix-turn-helix domain-containing protein n=1 Tax=Sphaerisporangium siamense TaxID=795645 RepID=A0A7W7D6X6_9ACTN|nr:helix-turn-helix domain-containing protein [Sphaerisporangium siamense]MBB4701414.1 hypothetical protein [Sphaerisporangium siamense]GII85537.1 transcriptional regulator [Sphaerisporangium siamense]
MSIDDLVQTLAEQLGGPVVLYDDDLGLVAFSVHGDEVDAARRSVILSRRASARAREMIAAHEVRRAHAPVRLPPHDGTPARVVYPIRLGRHVVGYASYIDHHPDGELPAHHAGALREAEPELAALLELRGLERRRDSDESRRLLAELLSTDAAARERAGDELIAHGLLSSAARYAVMVFRSVPSARPAAGAAGNARAGSGVPAGRLAGVPVPAQDAARPGGGTRLAIEQAMAVIVRSTSLKGCGAVLGEEGVLVIPRPVNRERLASLLAHPGLEAVRGGGGGPRDEPAQVHESYREAVMACRVAMADPARHGTSAHWDDLGLDRLLIQLPLAGLTPGDLPPTVRRLLEAPSGGKLADTLEAYLDSGADAQATARALLIHRSTLYYRLGRIHDLTRADLSDGRVRTELHTALRVATLSGLRPS